MVGGAVGFYSGEIRRLADDLMALKPTMMPAVPRLLNRLYDKAQSEISSSKIKRLLFNMALSAKESELKRSDFFFLFKVLNTKVLTVLRCRCMIILISNHLPECSAILI